MRLTSPPSFLVFERLPNSKTNRIRIVASQAEVLTHWLPSTRLSPVFGIKEYGTESLDDGLTKTRHLIFLGPIHPELVAERLGTHSRLWLTLGLFNVIVATNVIKDRRSLLEWARKEDILFEAWTLNRGIVKDTELSPPRPEHTSSDWRADLSALSERITQEELQDAVKEYCPLMASTLARSEQVIPSLVDNLKHVQESVLGIFKRAPKIAPNDAQFVILGQVLTINASLSRFASQTFAGTSPIIETECHFWSHSLLGIGVATLGLWRLREFLQRTLGEARIPSRFCGLVERQNDRDLTRLPATDQFWLEDHLANPTIEDGEPEPLVPLLTYFSARDGFKSVLATISAPLATVAKCNSLKWSLNTISHEISHVIIRSILGDLYPDLRSPAELTKALQLYGQGHPASTLFDEIRRLMLITIVKMESPHEGQHLAVHTNEAFRTILESWHREVEEILVHVFDLLYFYGGDPRRYLTGIWLSWGTIPHINRRVREYAIRSVCAVLAKHLRRGGEAENQAREETLDVLSSLPESKDPESYVYSAITLLNKSWAGDIEDEVLARKGLVKIASTFLFSSSVAYSVRKETELVGGTEKEKAGYSLQPNVIEMRKILNPLHFLELFTKSRRASEVESAWMFYVLAFCIRDAAIE